MSKATSICRDTTRGRRQTGQLEHRASCCTPAISRSPCNLICTEGWLSSAVVKISDRLVGIVRVPLDELWSLMPPLVSIPSDSGRDVEKQDVLDLT